jgi:hypothetical protein
MKTATIHINRGQEQHQTFTGQVVRETTLGVYVQSFPDNSKGDKFGPEWFPFSSQYITTTVMF